jgi:HNH endonuclease
MRRRPTPTRRRWSSSRPTPWRCLRRQRSTKVSIPAPRESVTKSWCTSTPPSWSTPTKLGSPCSRAACACRFPGCGVRFGQGHHIRHWAHGGPTTLSNLTMLCRRHHRAVHEEGYQVERQPDGELQFRRPNGWVIPEVPRSPDLPADPLAIIRARHEENGLACTRERRCRAGWVSLSTWATRSMCCIR